MTSKPDDCLATKNSDEFGRRTVADRDGGSVTFVIDMPKRDETGSYFVEYSLDGLIWSGKVRRAFGIDEIQAIYLALQSIGSDLASFQESSNHRLNWIGGREGGDLGLPEIQLNYNS